MGLWSLSDKSILIIDDFAQMRSMLSFMLKNYRPGAVQQAANGKEAIEKIKNHKFDIILCDYNLGPGQDGQQILEEIRHLRLMPFNTLFIMITAENTNKMVMGAAEYTPDDYLAKPINKNILISRLQKLLVKKQHLTPLSDALEHNDSSKAIECCNDLLEQEIKFKLEILSIKCEHLLKLNKYEEASTISDEILSKRDIPWAMNISGKIHLNNGDHLEAENIFKKIIDIDKNFMPAYDSLAKILELNENYTEAQKTLSDAVKISPKSVTRQRNLAKICIKNNDLSNAERAHKSVVHIGKTSCLKQSTDYTNLADLYIRNGDHTKATEALSDAIKSFRTDDKVVIESSVKLSSAYKHLNNSYKYNTHVNAALKLLKKDSNLIHGHTALELAQNCFDTGNIDQGKELLMSTAKEFYDDVDMINSIKNIFEDAGLIDEGNDIIARAKSEIVELNNKGVKLIKDNSIDEAIKLFQIAVQQMPENITITLNMATSLMLHMQKNGSNKKNLADAYNYLDVVFCKDKNNSKALDIKRKCDALS